MITTSGDDDSILFVRVALVVGRPENCMGHEMRIGGESMKAKATTYMGHKHKAVSWAMRMCGL